jgi:hypothetical protein
MFWAIGYGGWPFGKKLKMRYSITNGLNGLNWCEINWKLMEYSVACANYLFLPKFTKHPSPLFWWHTTLEVFRVWRGIKVSTKFVIYSALHSSNGAHIIPLHNSHQSTAILVGSFRAKSAHIGFCNHTHL